MPEGVGALGKHQGRARGQAQREHRHQRRVEAGREPHDRAPRDLFGELSTLSNDFRTMRAAHDVRIRHDRVRGDTTRVDANSETSGEQPLLPPRPVLPDMAAAHRRGPADAVEARWQSLRLAWQWRYVAHQIHKPGHPYPGIVPLLDAAAAQPRLRRLYPFTSHFALLFSSSTGYPWTVQAGTIEPLLNGRFRVHRRKPFTVIGEVGTAEEAVNLLLELLPTGTEPVITTAANEPI
ncbi:DUF6193 family natural product biosynthesis protein [Streptomyces sp. NPDC050418]|uniref:DUF6193 family natural product biosynthesis protein n=1 Tax=Streptomyces sp. NPDC050418 TaxID=3365612 RepID=UPI0037B6702C